MVKGVNKKIIEVNNPDSIYFEKAVFYLRPHIRELPAEITNGEIEKYILHTGLEAPPRHRHIFLMRLSAILLLIAAALCVLFILF